MNNNMITKNSTIKINIMISINIILPVLGVLILIQDRKFGMAPLIKKYIGNY
jgi:hypothetical protein